MSEHQSRRRFLYLTGAAGITALAGCASGGSTQTSTDDGSDDGGSGSDGGGGGDSGWTETSTVDMTDDLKYTPRKIKVEKGTTVTFKNSSSIGHTVTAYENKIPDGATYFASGGFDSQKAAEEGYSNGQKGNLATGDTYEHTFETTGTYEYYCIPHEMSGMVGSIKVV